jgi:putative restriction endonuclease
MKTARKNWSYEELLVAFNLYCKIPFGRIHIHNPEIIALANAIGRSPSAVSWKLANFARLDPSLKERSIVGASHGGKGEIEIWEEFSHDWERLSFESEKLLGQMTGKSVEETAKIDENELPRQGKEREAIVRIRVNQYFFRTTVLAAYDCRCCITGLAITDLLNASHIIPWAMDSANRVNPRNGLCLNVIHDRAFDRGLLTITPQYKVKISTSLQFLPDDDAAKEFLLRYDGVSIKLPSRFSPEPSFLSYHNEQIFKN